MKTLIIIIILLFSFSTKVSAETQTSSSTNLIAQTNNENDSSGIEAVRELIKSLFPKGETPQGSIPSDQIDYSSPGANIQPSSGFIFYCQGNTQWQNSCSLGAAGCGPTSLAMVLSTLGRPFGIQFTPPQVDQIFRQNGWRSCSEQGSYMMNAITSPWLRGLGFQVGQNLAYNGILDLKQAKNYLDRGYLIIGSSKNFPCANCKSARRIDHIFVIDNVNIESSSVSIRDPNNCSYADGNDENPANIIKSVSAFTWFYAFPIKKL